MMAARHGQRKTEAASVGGLFHLHIQLVLSAEYSSNMPFIFNLVGRDLRDAE
jgi:hypothetical protein